MSIKTLLIVALLIVVMPCVQASIFKKQNVDLKELSLNFLKSNQFANGNKIAEFYISKKDKSSDSFAYDLWQRLIYKALDANQIDSAKFLANAFATNMPKYDLPKKILSMLPH